jgi:acyl transferase domain-containing protein
MSAEDGTGYRLFPLSAASRPALRSFAARLAGEVAAGSALCAVGRTLALRDPHLAERAVVAAAGRDELAAGLRKLAAGEQDSRVVGGRAAGAGAGLVWVFSGHGSQWTGMGRELLSEPPFATVIDELDPLFAAEIGFSPRQALGDGDFLDIARAQTMIFAMQMGLAALWGSCGVSPIAVIGHSVGEIAAAVVSGTLSLHEGGRLICRRSRLLRRVAGQGGMAMVTIPFPQVAERLAGRRDLVAAIASSPGSTVVAGDPAAIGAVVDQWPAPGVAVRRVPSDVAFHSPHMEPLLADLEESVADLRPRPPVVPAYSTALADPRSALTADGKYWAANLRNPVRLAAAVIAAAEDGYRDFLEVSPHPVVARSVSDTLASLGLADKFVGVTLRRNRPQRLTFLTSAAAVYCRGIELDWRRLQPADDLVMPPAAP